MGKIILLALILFAFYWGMRYYKGSNKVVEVKDEPQDNIDKLVNYYNQKISEIESKSIEEIKKQEEILSYYKEQLNKINQMKNKQTNN